MEVKDGCSTSFWSFHRIDMGCLFDLRWLSRCIDMFELWHQWYLCLADARGGIWSIEILNPRLGLLLRTNVLSLLIQRMSLFGNRKKVPIHRVHPSCIFCQQKMESRKHLFSECDYSAAVWTKLARALLRTHFTKVWDNIIQLLVSNTLECRIRLRVRYGFQVPNILAVALERKERETSWLCSCHH